MISRLGENVVRVKLQVLCSENFDLKTIYPPPTAGGYNNYEFVRKLYFRFYSLAYQNIDSTAGPEELFQFSSKLKNKVQSHENGKLFEL